ncbi:MAG: sodium:solute symporter family protein [bacterium]|nr:sodium:solute symporter family protein [bacterium]
MAAIHLTMVDWLIVLLYFVFIIGIGLYLRKFTVTGEDFFLAGRRSSSWMAGLAFLSANLGALEILGWTGGTMKYGMFVSHFYWIGAIPAMLFLGLYMMPFYYSSKIHSVPGYLKLRFDERSRLLNAFSFAVMTLLMSGINLYLMALVLRTILGWDWHLSMWVSALSIGVYIALGGLLSAIFTEIVQFFLIWFGLFLVAILGTIEMGGLGQVFAQIPPEMARLWATTGDPSQNAMGVTWLGIVVGLGFVLSFGYWTTDFLVVQRAFSSKNLRAARLAPITASFFKMALPFIIVVSGLVAWRLTQMAGSDFHLLPHPSTGEPWNDTAFPLLIARYYPPGLVGLGITALLAGFMAGQAGNISAFNTVWTYDIYRVIIKKDATDKHLVLIGRVTTIIAIVLSVLTAYVAMQFNTIMDYIQAIFSWVNAPLFATMLLGMFWKRCTSTGAFYGLLAGMGSSFLMFLGLKFAWFSSYWLTFSQNASDMSNNLWRAWWAWLICFVVTILISLVTKPKSDKELEGLVKGLTPNPDLEKVSLIKRPTFWAAISLVVAIALNIYFW